VLKAKNGKREIKDYGLGIRSKIEELKAQGFFVLRINRLYRKFVIYYKRFNENTG
jgi:hypothetical protein